MKQSVDLMNSMKRFSFRHSNIGFRHSNTVTFNTTSLARRALLLLTVLSMGVGNVWGQTFNGTLIPGARTYSKYIKNNVYTTTIDMTEDLSQIVSDLNELKGSSDYTIDNIYQHIYIRWCIKDASNNIVTSIIENGYSIGANDWHVTSEYLYNNAPWKPTNGNIFWFYTYNYLYQDADFKAKILKPQFTINSGKTFADYDGYTLECYITDETDGLTYAEHPEWSQTGSITSEPANLKIKYTYVFNATGKKPDTFSGALKGTGQALSGGAVVGKAEQLTTSATNATLDFSAALAEASSSTYVRFYLEKDGEAVDPTGKLTVTGGTIGPEKEHGFYIYKSGGLSSTDVDNDVTLELTAGEYEDYQVVAVFGYGEPSGDPLHEVDWDLQYKYAFEYPFKGDASAATKVEKAITMLSSEWSALSEAYLKFDLANKKIKLTKSDGTVLGTVAAIDESDFTNFWNNYPSNTLGGTDNFYVRYVLVNKSTGIEQGFKDQTLGSTTSVGGINLYYPQKHKYGRVWSTKLDGSNKDLNKIMMVKLWPDGQFDWTDYDVVVYIGTCFIQLLTWSYVGQINLGVSIRYFIPLLALIPIIVPHKNYFSQKEFDNYAMIFIISFMAALILAFATKYY